jgi:SAM-dependent methyltransferase
MSYIKQNKKAWELAFDNKDGLYAKDMLEILNNEKDPYLLDPMIKYLDQIDLRNLKIGQFCTNNGRELLSIAKRGIKEAVGFDIAKNMVDYGNQIAKFAQLPVTFYERNILEIEDDFNDTFDLLIITVGALCWFDDLNQFFKVVNKVLKNNGTLVIHEAHPVLNMLATKDEPSYQKDHEKEIVYDYFKVDPWETGSMGYMTNKNVIQTQFYSFSHPISHIFNGISNNQFRILSFDEYDYCIANLVPHLDHQGIPLSFFLTAKKEG